MLNIQHKLQLSIVTTQSPDGAVRFRMLTLVVICCVMRRSGNYILGTSANQNFNLVAIQFAFCNFYIFVNSSCHVEENITKSINIRFAVEIHISI